jgi:hypothetical protein
MTVALLGGGDTWLTGVGDLYQQAFAASTRCLALLVGINTYLTTTWQTGAIADKATPLQGAVTDVELQKELLIYRLGVPAANILTLTNEQASVENILTGIQDHLLRARAGDTVLLHFSGLGSQARVMSGQDSVALPTWVAADSFLPDSTAPAIQDLFEETIAQLLQPLTGVNVITVVDASSTPRPMQLLGNFRVRSRPLMPEGAWALPSTLAEKTRLRSPTQSLEELSKNWPGLLIRGETSTLPALEGTWSGRSAGLLTYALTQQLWHYLPHRQQYWVGQIDRTLSTWTGIDAMLTAQGKATVKTLENMLVLSGLNSLPPSDGVITGVDESSQTATVWLGGLTPNLLVNGNGGLGLKFQLVADLSQGANTGAVQPTLIVKTVSGFKTKAEVKGPMPIVGMPLVEVERRIPRDLPLLLALDPSLERIERVDATSALSSLAIATVVTPGEQAADCMLGRLRPEETADTSGDTTKTVTRDMTAPPAEEAELNSTLPKYGLFTPGHRLLPGTPAVEGEAVKKAVGRLSQPLRALLATKLCRLVLNQASSQVPLRMTAVVSNSGLLGEDATYAFLGSDVLTQEKRRLEADLSAGDAAYEVILQTQQQPLHYLLLAVLQGTRFMVYCPKVEIGDEMDASSRLTPMIMQLVPEQVLAIPGIQEVGKGRYPIDVFAIAMPQPFTQIWKAIRTPEFGNPSDRWAAIPDPLPIVKALLSDLHQASLITPLSSEPPSDTVFALRPQTWAAVTLRLSTVTAN